MGEAQPGKRVTPRPGPGGATAPGSPERTAETRPTAPTTAVGPTAAAAPQRETFPTTGAPDGLAARVAEVEAARARLGHNLEHVQSEVRAQIGYTVERILWKIAAAGAAVAAAVAVRKVLTLGWRAARKSEPPENPASRSTGWGDAVLWTAATGVGVAVAKVVATRGAAAGWERATGNPPPED